jgi:hypothetical protein
LRHPFFIGCFSILYAGDENPYLRIRPGKGSTWQNRLPEVSGSLFRRHFSGSFWDTASDCLPVKVALNCGYTGPVYPVHVPGG